MFCSYQIVKRRSALTGHPAPSSTRLETFLALPALPAMLVSLLKKVFIGSYADLPKTLAAVSFLHSALVWLDRIVSGKRRTGLGTGFIV